MRSPLLRFRISLGFFIVGLVVSGLTAFPLAWETSFLHRMLGGTPPADLQTVHGLREWVAFVTTGIRETYARFPFFGYGTDWLGFSHLVIAAFFLLPFANPQRYRAILHIGLAACGGVIVVALVCGPWRGIPFGWQLIDCSFGVIGAIPLLYCLYLTDKIHTR